MKTLVERIRNRELAIKNDGSLEELRKVLFSCFPDDVTVKDIDMGKFFYSSLDWDYSSETDLPTISVKEVLAEIEGNNTFKKPHKENPIVNGEWIDKPKTKVIYLNEEDRPKTEEPFSFVKWQECEYNYFRDNNGIIALGDGCLNKATKEYAEYLNNFNPNDKPIKFEKVYILSEKDYQVCHNSPSNMDLVIVVDKETFIGIKTNEEYAQWRFKGNLNNGKVK